MVKRKPKEDLSIKENVKIFVGGIPVQVTSDEFIQYFKQFGVVEDFILPLSLQGKKLNCGYGFVHYKDPLSVSQLLASNARHVLRAKVVRLLA